VELSVDLGAGVMLPLMLVPAGGTRIGTPTTEPGFEWDEQLRGITVPAPFYMSKYQLTRGQYKAIMGQYPSYSSNEDTTGGGDSLPARISYADIEALVVTALNAKLPQGFVSRIPPKELWEHACRAGTQTTWYSGIDEAALARIGWYQGNSGNAIHRVGQKEPNPWGLYDMVGNVWTWAYTSGGATAASCYVKGGSFNSEAFGNGCRTGNLMIQSVPSGFRVMVDLPASALGVRPTRQGARAAGTPAVISRVPLGPAGPSTLRLCPVFSVDGRRQYQGSAVRTTAPRLIVIEQPGAASTR
jgi:hypothetical protein